MPLFRVKKGVFEWVKTGKKTIDLRKGKAFQGEIAVVVSGPDTIKFRIAKKETGKLENLVRKDNFGLIVPLAETVEDAVGYIREIYYGYDGIFTAYYLASL